MATPKSADHSRPYLVIPKLIEQPTWGGSYIATAKGWHSRPLLANRKIGQSYELFSGSNLSLAKDSRDLNFIGELTDRDAVQLPTKVSKTVSLADLLAISPTEVLGKTIAKRTGNQMQLLIKFTQARGNSFQLHLKDGESHPRWTPKPESWYFFEPGIATLGVKQNIDWQAYESATYQLDQDIRSIGHRLACNEISHAKALKEVNEHLNATNPHQHVNLVHVPKNQLLDLTAGGVHHSWEEDDQAAPLGNVLYELQLEAMDDVSTLRSFDKGQMGPDGSTRDLHIKDYFDIIDRSPAANEPKTYLRQPQQIITGSDYTLDQLMNSSYYGLDRLNFHDSKAIYTRNIDQFNHVFVKNGRIKLSAGDVELTITGGHSAFIPAVVKNYAISAQTPDTEVLISY